MTYLLNLIYVLVLTAASPYLAWKALRTGKYRHGWGAKFLGRVPRRNGDRPCYWFHAVSVGEVNLLARLLREIREQAPQIECVVSTTTRTGMELAQKKYADLTVFYCPLDFSWAVRTALRRIRPDVLVLAELELWPNLIRLAHRRGVCTAVVNGRLSEASFHGYRRIRPLVANMLRHVDLVAVQDETYAERFRLLGMPADRVQVTGSMKYDGAETDRNNPATQQLRQWASLGEDNIVFLAGSTQEPEERLALEVWQELSPQWPNLWLILVPRHPERFEAVARMLDASGVVWRRRSDSSNRSSASNSRVLLIDVIGELGAWWGTARAAFVGGSMGSRGGQNMIEPAGYGAAVCFGPNTRNFRDVVATMLAHKTATVVDDGAALGRFVRWTLEHPNEADQLGQRARALVLSQQGATARTRALLLGLTAKKTS